jgi:hypothetical protein
MLAMKFPARPERLNQHRHYHQSTTLIEALKQVTVCVLPLSNDALACTFQSVDKYFAHDGRFTIMPGVTK